MRYYALFALATAIGCSSAPPPDPGPQGRGIVNDIEVREYVTAQEYGVMYFQHGLGGLTVYYDSYCDGSLNMISPPTGIHVIPVPGLEETEGGILWHEGYYIPEGSVLAQTWIHEFEQLRDKKKYTCEYKPEPPERPKPSQTGQEAVVT